MLKIQNQQGITLLELIVAISIFSAIVLATSQVFVRTNDVQQRTAIEHNIQAELRYGVGTLLFESSQSEERTSNVCTCGTCGDLTNKYFGTNVGTNDRLYFLNNGVCIQYYLDNGILKVDRDGTIFDLTSNKITIQKIYFNVGANNDRYTVGVIAKKDGKETIYLKYQNSITRSDYEN